MAAEKKPSAPTWRKTRRLSPLQRFKMYNPLKMDFYLKPSREQFNNNNDLSFDMSNSSPQMIRLQIEKIKKMKAELTKKVSSTMNKRAGEISATGAEKVYEISQKDIKENVDFNSAKKIFELKLTEYGAYNISYTKNGQYLALGGSKGHLAIMRWKDFRLVSEEYFNNDYIHDVKFCVNESMLATAQRAGVYIYDAKCVETHVLKKSMPYPLKLEYLPYHFLLCSIGQFGKLVYFDVSVGKRVAEKNTKLGKCDVMCANPNNAIIHCGHNNGVVTLWTPTNQHAVASILCHKSPIRGVCVDYQGYNMAVSDTNGNLSVWDMRMYKEKVKYRSNSQINSLCFSQRGLLGFSTGRTCVIWNLQRDYKPCDESGYKEMEKRHEKLFLQHILEGQIINQMEFCPYEDILGIGTSSGFSSIVVPGAGEPNYDIFEADPFETTKKRDNKIIHQLLDKLRPDMIQLNPDFVANIPRSSSRIEEQRKEAEIKFARKNLTKSVKTGYRGLIRRRYSKYHFMKDIHHRQQHFQSQIKNQNKINNKNNRTIAIERKARLTKKLLNNSSHDSNAKIPSISKSALLRFRKPNLNRSKPAPFRSNFKKKQKIYF